MPDDRERRPLDALWRAAMRVAYRLQLAWWFVRRPVIEGAYVAVWHAGRVLVVRNSYRRRLTFPAGGLVRGESALDAAVRELAEEAGIVVAPERLAYHGEIVNRDGWAEDHAHVYELRCDSEPAVVVDHREVVWGGFLAPEDALARGVVGVVRRYLAAATASANDTPSRSIRR